MKRIFCLVIALLLPALAGFARVATSDIDLDLAQTILAESSAHIYPGSRSSTKPLEKGDTEIVVGWKVAVPHQWPMLRAALELYTWPSNMDSGTQSFTVTDPTIMGVEYTGKWRNAGVDRVRRGEGVGDVYWIVLTLRSGYAETIAWDEARLIEYKQSASEATALGSNVVANTTGFATGQYAVVRWRNISPYKINACMASLNAEVYSNQAVYGETLAGTWYNLIVAGDKDDDGAGVVDMVLSRQRFTIAGYDFYNTVRQSSNYRIFGVPKTIAQEIIDAWQGDGRSADASYNPATELCTVTLRDRDAVKDNMSTGDIQTGCDESFEQHFAWGYTKTEIRAWVVTHNGSTDSQPTTRTVTINDRGDGLFNGIIVERQFDTLDDSAPQITITLPIGTNITRQTDYGYNYNRDELSAATIQNQYDETIKDAGVTVDFSVTREDDCSFDWRAVIQSQVGDIIGSIDTGNEGIRRVAYSMRGATGAEIADLTNSVRSGPRTNVSVSINMRDDNLADVQAELAIVQSNTATFDSGTQGVRVAIASGVNVDEGDIPTNSYRSGPRTNVTARIAPQEDGTFNFDFARQVVRESINIFNSGSNGIQSILYSGVNADSLPTNIASAPLTRVSPNITIQDDGTVNYNILVNKVQSGVGSYDSGLGGVRAILYYGANVTSVTNVVASSRLTQVSPRITAQDDGTVNYAIESRTLKESSITLSAGTSGASVSETIGRNKSTATSSAGGDGVTTEILAAGFDDAGNLQYRVRTTTRSAKTDDVSGGTLLNPVTYSAGTGDAAGPANDAPSQGNTSLFSLRVNQDGTREWTKQAISSSEAAPSGFTWAILRPASRVGGYTERAVVFRNKNSVPSVTDDYYYFKRLSINDDGTYDGEYVAVEYDVDPDDEVDNFKRGTYSLKERTWDEQQINTGASKIRQNIYHIITWSCMDTVHDSYSAAANAISGGDAQRSTISRVQVNGRTKYLAKKAVFAGMIGPYTAGGSWYYDLRTD